MSKNILFLLPNFNGGGAESVFVQLANYFSLKNCVQFLVLNKLGPNLMKLNSNIKVTELNTNSAIKSIFKINSFIKKNDIDVAIGTLSMAYALSISNLFGIKKCTYIARVGSIISANLANLNLLKKFIMNFYQKTLNFSDIIITQSKFMDIDLKKYVNKETHVIYNPIARNRILKLSTEKSKIILEKKYFNIVSVGRLSFEKDYKTAILSIAKIRNKISKIRYYILGAGNLKEELLKYSCSLGLEKNIIFTGYLNNPYPIMKKANVILLTSLYEGFSNVLLESLALNVPVVATNSAGGNKEIILDGINGFLAKVGNSNDIAEKIIRTSKQKKFIFKVSKFKISFIAREYEKLFKKI